MMKTATLLLLLAVVLNACAPAVTPTAVPTETPEPMPDVNVVGAEIDALLQKNHQEGVVDCSVLVAQNGQVIFSQGYGYADRYQKIPNTPQTKYGITIIQLCNHEAVMIVPTEEAIAEILLGTVVE